VLHFCDAQANEPHHKLMLTTLLNYSLPLFSSGGQLIEIGLFIFLIATSVWVFSTLRLVNRFSSQFSIGKVYRTKLILTGLANKLQLQESIIAQASRELDRIGSDSLGTAGKVIEGPLGSAITTLRSRIEVLRKSESTQSWVAQGVTKVSALRKNHTQIEDYTLHLTSLMAKYVGASQAAFFTLIENESMKLSAGYGVDKRKQEEICRADGLLGQSITEKQLIHITEVPKNFVKVASGLGEVTPKCLVLAPLVYREQVFGVIELASLKDFEPQHLEFIQKSSEEIASELAAMQVQTETRRLLEQAQAQATQLAAHEEELKQNMEEMQATQEEMSRKEIELQEKLGEIESERAKNLAILESCMDAVVSFSLDGAIEFCNKAGEDMLGYTRYELASHSIFKMLNLHLSFNGDEPILLSKGGNQITTKSEVNTTDRNGDELSLLLTATHIRLKGKSMFTLFAQKISVDLF
jgi:PAS domain S-box-containing protein